MPMTPLLDLIPMRRTVEGNRVIFEASAGMCPSVELEDEIKRISERVNQAVRDDSKDMGGRPWSRR